MLRFSSAIDIMMGLSHFLNNMTRLKGDEDMPGQKKPGSVGFLQEKHLQVCTNHIKYFASGNFYPLGHQKELKYFYEEYPTAG